MAGYLGPKAIQYNVDNSVVHGDSSVGGDLTVGDTLLVNRKTTDGDIITLQKDNSTVGSVGTANFGDLYIGNEDTTLLFAGGSDAILPRGTAGASRDAEISLGLSSHRFKDLYLSGGVYLGGTAADNKLDEYEEGAWTPSFNTSNNDMILTQGIQSGSYTKVGNVVTAFSYIQCLTPSTAGSGILQISGFPYTTSSEICLSSWSDAGPIATAYNATYTQFYGRMVGSRFEFRRVGAGTTANWVDPSELQSGYMLMAVTYNTDA